MNSYQVSNTQSRASCAAVAVLASTLVLSSVLFLFASASPASAPESALATQPLPVATAHAG